MSRVLKHFISFLILSFSMQLAWGQNSTIGREFWVGFMENVQVYYGESDKAVLIITADEKTTGAIEYLGQTASFDLEKGEQFIFKLESLELDLLHRTSEEVEDKGVYIISTGNIAVHAFSEQIFSADGTVILPVKTLGRDYLVTSHYEEGNGPATLLIVAVEDNTEIEIVSPIDSFNGKSANIPFTILLNQGQSYQLKANGDLTGTRVKVLGEDVNDCKKIAVFGGNMCTTVGGCLACDHLFQQSYPVSTWGTDYIHVALKGRTSGELVKVLASEDGTMVRVDGNLRGTIDRGQFMVLDFQVDESAKIVTSQPSSVTVFSKGMLCNDVLIDELLFDGDPFMLTYSSNEQSLKELVFNSIKLPKIENHYVNIVVKSGTQDKTVLDGKNIGEEFFPLLGDPGFQIGRISISEGVHHLTNPDGFTAYAYGFGRTESYGYAAGAALDNLSLDFESNYEFEVVGDKVACLNQEGVWSANISDPSFEYFFWDFGDGSPVQSGREVPHTFTEPGRYVVSVSVSKTLSTCEDQEEASFEVEVFEMKAKLEGETYVCQQTDILMYRLLERQNIESTEFEVIGGEIIEAYADSVLVKWGQASTDARVIMNPISKNGCPGLPVTLEVVIGADLNPVEPIGPREVCFNPELTQIYSVESPLAEREYEWEVVGGSIVSGQGSGEIEVMWDQPGIEGKVGYTVYSSNNASCSGMSPKAVVIVTSQMAIAKTTSVACFGELSGQIELTMIGGQGPYSFEWLHDPTLSSPIATDLAKGVYTVLVTDKNGCSQRINDIEVLEPELLEVVSVEPVPITCLGRSDGLVSLSVNGGTKPYQLDYNGIHTFSEEITITNLPMGNFDLEVIDKNGCKVTVNFEINSPPPLKVEVRLAKPACPGEENGELIVVTDGIIGPKDFNWIGVGQSSALATGLAKGEYHLELRDSDNCIYVGQGWVEEAAPEIRMPTGFDPRMAPGAFLGVSNCDVLFDLWIYNRWGELVYFNDTGWNGKIHGKDAPTGAYAYIARYYYVLDGINHQVEKKGAFVLMR
ncbi:PKD domain-containing protein [Echinicola sp. CAU 1574]|uniref:PKD domain-containing protein n=1 Tax=Echinicola arenosa TaxID=2774144 RepID=A0ABR9AHG9_9BACT|nr:PKD domain-containing protein [Echinicola arenosa]MBD8487974.1 PKD domain-containing protein [Echinicola arenosa]